MLFDNQRRHAVSLPSTDSSGQPANIAFLIDHLCKNLMKDPRTDLFVLDNHMCVSSPTSMLSNIIANSVLVAPASSSSSTTPIGSSKARRLTRSSRVTTSCLSQPCMEASLVCNQPQTHQTLCLP